MAERLDVSASALPPRSGKVPRGPWGGSLEAPPYCEVLPGVLLRSAAAGTRLCHSREESWAWPRRQGGPRSGTGGGLGRRTGLSPAAPPSLVPSV
ncbi:hypothetical protein NDU88_004256 [Pleurodeles waltl]|uniref:Uncharacterized protein n=1 Tax=Pleurodeles waltl TaxID=8319 RepID=A0AAV7VJT6_PLEWA|nr:hypothetical protein NDU88_004256 [Pleurodeles waltl]